MQATQNKLVHREGDVETHVLNLPMVELSPAEEAGLAAVTSGAKEHHNSCLLNHRLQLIPLPLALPYLIYKSILYYSTWWVMDGWMNHAISQMWPRSQQAYNPRN